MDGKRDLEYLPPLSLTEVGNSSQIYGPSSHNSLGLPKRGPYHPQANGMVEHLHRQLKAALKCHASSASWMMLLGVQTALKEDLNCTTAELMYGTTLRQPGEFFDPTTATSTPMPRS